MDILGKGSYGFVQPINTEIVVKVFNGLKITDLERSSGKDLNDTIESKDATELLNVLDHIYDKLNDKSDREKFGKFLKSATFKSDRVDVSMFIWQALFWFWNKSNGQLRNLLTILFNDPDGLKKSFKKFISIITNRNNEMNILKKLHGKDNIVQIIDTNPSVTTFLNEHYYVGFGMERCESDLNIYLIQHKSMKLDKKIYLINQLMEGIKCIHKNNIAHLDIKLHNILMNKEQLKICDFGISIENTGKAFDVEYDHLCTPMFRPPELFKLTPLNSFYDLQKVDMWCVGCVIYSILTGFAFMSKKEFDSAIINDKINNEQMVKILQTKIQRVKNIIDNKDTTISTSAILRDIFKHYVQNMIVGIDYRKESKEYKPYEEQSNKKPRLGGCDKKKNVPLTNDDENEELSKDFENMYISMDRVHKSHFEGYDDEWDKYIATLKDVEDTEEDDNEYDLTQYKTSLKEDIEKAKSLRNLIKETLSNKVTEYTEPVFSIHVCATKKRLTYELDILKKLKDCNNIIQVLDPHPEIRKVLNKQIGYAFEYTTTLDVMIKNKVSFDKDRMVLQLLEGIDYIHKKEIIHLNIFPQNIYIYNDVLKIGNFSMSKTKRTEAEENEVNKYRKELNEYTKNAPDLDDFIVDVEEEFHLKHSAYGKPMDINSDKFKKLKEKIQKFEQQIKDGNKEYYFAQTHPYYPALHKWVYPTFELFQLADIYFVGLVIYYIIHGKEYTSGEIPGLKFMITDPKNQKPASFFLEGYRKENRQMQHENEQIANQIYASLNQKKIKIEPKTTILSMLYNLENHNDTLLGLLEALDI
jgi:serine/threonine protein kinase